MRYIQALKEKGYNLKSLPSDIKKAISLVFKSKDYNSKVEALDFITFNSIRNSQPVDERIEELHKLSLTDHSVENNNGFNTPLSIEIVEQEFGDGGHIATKDDNNKVRNWKVRFHLGRGENYLHWKVENPKTKEVIFYNPDEYQITMYNCKLTNSPSTSMKIFTGQADKSPIAWVVCEKYKTTKKIDPVDSDERLTFNPRTAPNWFDSDGDNVDNFVFEKLITFGRGVYYEAPDGTLFALGGVTEYHLGGNMSKHLAPNDKPSNLTHEQWHLVRTPEFKGWFGFWDLFISGKSKNYYDPEVRKVAKELKTETPSAIKKAVDFLSQQVTENDVLIPMPSRTGKATDTQALAEQIASKTGAKVFNCLVGKARESIYELKLKNENVSQFNFNFQINCEIPKATNYFIVDNVIGTGVSMKNALQKVVKEIGENVSPLVYAIDLTNISKVVDNNGEPLVVYHGSRSRVKFAFSEFDVPPEGVYFSSDFTTATWFSSGYDYKLQFEEIELPNNLNENSSIEELEKYYKNNIDPTAYTEINTFDDGTIMYRLYTYNESVSSPLGQNLKDAKARLFQELQYHIERINNKTSYPFYNVFLNIRKPYKIDAKGNRFDKTPFEDGNYAAVSVTSEIKSRGKNDGVIIKNTIETTELSRKSNSYIVFNANQIKLADGTNNSFDVNNPDIRFSYGGHITPSRFRVPNVRGGWTKDKIIKYFKDQGSDVIGTPAIAKYISEFDNWQQFKDHIYYHGTTNHIENGLKPSMAFSERWAEQQGGGGYGDRYFGVSLTKRKRTAEIFAGQSSGVNIYPVILKRDAKVIERPDFQDASDVEDIIIELYEQGIDAVWIGGGEEELVVVNPFSILLYKKGREYHSAYGGFKSVALTDEKIKEIYDNSLQIWEDFLEAKREITTKEERDELLYSIPAIQFESGGAVQSPAPDIYENKLMQIRVIGGANSYYKRVNQEWKFLSPEELEKLKSGTKHELEHFTTIEAFKRRDIPNEIIASFIAYDHIKEDLNYYEKLDKAIPEKMENGKKIPEYSSQSNEKPTKENSLRYHIENHYSAGMIASGTELSKYDDIDAIRSIMLRIIRDEEGENEYTIPFNFYELNSLKEKSLIELKENPVAKETIKEMVSKPDETPLPLKEHKMEDNNQAGSVSNWNEVPVRWKNVKAIRPISFSLNPYDKGLNLLIKEFLGKDDLRPVMTGMYFDESGVVCTDAHKLLHIHYKKSDFKGTYATANTIKALKYSRSTGEIDITEATEKIKDDKYPNWIAVIPRDNPYVYEVDIMKLYQYLNVAINYANKTTQQVAFRYDNGKVIGFNGKFFMQGLEAMMKMQKCTKVFLHMSEPSRAMIISYDRSITPSGNTYVLTMPVMLRSRVGDLDERGRELKITQVLGANDPDYQKSLSCYFDFTDSQIHNGDGSIADYQESYGDAGEMPLALITMLDKFIKISNPRNEMLQNVCVDGNGIRVDSIDARIEVANDYNLPQGLYRIEKNALIKNTLNGSVDDFPRLTSRVSTQTPVFTMSADAFKFYVQKAFEHTGDDDLRPTMKCILFEYYQGGDLQIVATDSYSLIHLNITKYASQIQNKNFSFPLAFTKELLNFTKNIDTKEVKLYVDEDKNYRIDGGRLHFEARLEGQKYPNWASIIPDKYSNQLLFDLKDLFVCVNNEVAKQFAKKEDLKVKNLSIFNQDDKIFISNFPKDNYKTEEHLSKEICNVKIKKETFDVAKSFNFNKENFILLMPNVWTNGNYFNWGLEYFTDVVASIGKEKVIVNYSDLNRPYIFTSDNLEYKTSDVYKPEKAVTTPVKQKTTSQQGKMQKHTEMVKRVQAEQKTTPTNFKQDKSGKLEPNSTQMKMQNTPVPEMDQKMKNQIELLEKNYNLKYDKKLMSDWGMRYIELRRKIYPNWQDVDKYFGKKIGNFKVGDVIGSLARNTDTDRCVVLEITNGKVYVIPYNYAYPKIREYDLSAGGWELIEPKQNLLVVDVTKKQPTSTQVSKSGKNPSEFNVGDIIENNTGVKYQVKTPKTKDNFSQLINLTDQFRKGEIDEWANTEHTKIFKLVSKKPVAKTSPVVSKMLGTGVSSPASETIRKVYEYQTGLINAMNTYVWENYTYQLNLEIKELKKYAETPKIKANPQWLKSVQEAISSSQKVLLANPTNPFINDKTKIKSPEPLSNAKKSSEDSSLKEAIRGLEAFMRTSNKFSETSQIKQAIKGLKALLK